MTLDEVLQELIQNLGSQGGEQFSWEQVREWPDKAVDIFEEAGWIKPSTPAQTVVCPGCEESCFMPVHSSPPRNGKPARHYVACDVRDDMGRVHIESELLQTWQITGKQVATWMARVLGLKGKPKANRERGVIEIGTVQGKKRTGLLELSQGESVLLKSGEHPLHLSEVVYFDGGKIQIDHRAITRLIDLPPSSERPGRYQPSDARREARKLDTQALYEDWQKEYRKLKRAHPGWSDKRCALTISKMPIGKGKNSETIRKNMK